jgi:Lar family restriction alleviation protein
MSERESALKPCAFCGGNARLLHTNTESGKTTNSFVLCDGCGCLFELAIITSEDGVIAAWNRRATNHIAAPTDSTARTE